MKYIMIVLAFLFFQCTDQQTGNEEYDEDYPSMKEGEFVTLSSDGANKQTSLPPQFSSEATILYDAKIIKTGNMTFEVSHLEEAKANIDSKLKAINGYYENETYQSTYNRNTYYLKLRIPNAKFDSLIQVMEKGIGELVKKSINAKDVSEEYVDLEIRIENKLAYLKQYQSILLQAKSIKEILDVQQKIRQIEEEIESKKGRLKYLDANVKYSTLDLVLSQLISVEKTSEPNYADRIIQAFNKGIQGLLNFIVGLVNYWPFLVFAMFIYFGRKPLWNRIRRKKTPTNNS